MNFSSRRVRRRRELRRKARRRVAHKHYGYWQKIGGGSLTAAIAIHLAILLAGAFWVFRTLGFPETQVDFQPSGRGGFLTTRSESVSVKASRRVAPAMPNITPKRVFAAGSASTFSIPPMDDSFGESSALSQFSNSNGFAKTGATGFKPSGGPGFGAGNGMGSGFGGGAGKAIFFFNQEVRAQNIAYVIDFSRTMKGKREKLMRDELSKSISQLAPSQKFQLIFFSGPVWCAGDQVEMHDDKRHAIVKSGKHTYRWGPNGKPGGWEVEGRRPRPAWLDVHRDIITTAIRQITETPLVYGTYWQPPLEIALTMDPPPHVVFFMTDGLTGANTSKVVQEITAKAKARKTVINTVAMMEPQAGASLRELAHATGGQFSMIEKDGTVVLEPTEAKP